MPVVLDQPPAAGGRARAGGAGTGGPGVQGLRRSFLLEPAGPDHPAWTVREAALTSWGMDAAGWEALCDRAEASGRAEVLVIGLDGVRNLDSRAAHHLIKLATARGIDPARAWDRSFSALLEHHEDLANPVALRRLGAAPVEYGRDSFSGSGRRRPREWARSSTRPGTTTSSPRCSWSGTGAGSGPSSTSGWSATWGAGGSAATAPRPGCASCSACAAADGSTSPSAARTGSARWPRPTWSGNRARPGQERPGGWRGGRHRGQRRDSVTSGVGSP